MTHATLTVIDGQKATSCSMSRAHRPVPLRYVWHHIKPQVCGGLTEPANVISLCDSCHYTIHALMWAAKSTGLVPHLGNKAQRKVAEVGYDRCVAAGTVDKIPHE
jgi:hypothetical protein